MKKVRSDGKHPKINFCDRFKKIIPEYETVFIRKTFVSDLPVLSADIEYPKFTASDGADWQKIEYLNGLLCEYAVSCLYFSENELKPFACDEYDKDDDDKKRFRFKRFYYSVKLEVEFCCSDFLCIVAKTKLQKAQLTVSETEFSLFFRLCDMKLIPQPKPSSGADGIFVDINGCVRCWHSSEDHSSERDNKGRFFRQCRCEEWDADSDTVVRLIKAVEKFV